MLPKDHIVLGFILSLILFLIFPSITLIGAGIIFLSSFLIDADHYIYYVFKKGNLNLLKSVKYFMVKRRKLISMKIEERKEVYSGFCFLHGIEILIIFYIMGMFLSKNFLLILIGFTFHIYLDLLEEINKNLRLDKISIIYDLIKFKKLKFLE